MAHPLSSIGCEAALSLRPCPEGGLGLEPVLFLLKGGLLGNFQFLLILKCCLITSMIHNKLKLFLQPEKTREAENTGLAHWNATVPSLCQRTGQGSPEAQGDSGMPCGRSPAKAVLWRETNRCVTLERWPRLSVLRFPAPGPEVGRSLTPQCWYPALSQTWASTNPQRLCLQAPHD